MQVVLPNYHYIALGHVHQPMALGKRRRGLLGSIERMDFGEVGEEKSVVLVEMAGGLESPPGVIQLHATELY